MKYLLLLGRILYSLIFLMSGIMGHLVMRSQTVAYAESGGVPMAAILVPLSGIMAILGAMSIILGYKTKFGAWLIIIFLIAVTFTMHRFWMVDDATMRQVQMAMFMKNLSMLGGAFIIAYFGAGPISVDIGPRTGEKERTA